MTTSHASRFAKLRPLPLAAARWTDGFWGERFQRCREVMIPTMGRLMSQAERERFVGNFEVAAGLVEGRHRGPKWNDGDFYKWLEAAAATLAFAPDQDLDQNVDAMIALIAKTQAPDGYIHTDVQITDGRGGADAKRFGNPMDFEMYNMGHLMTAACVHHAATGKENFLTVARRSADFLDKQFANPTPDQARHGICPSHLMGLIDLYRTTGESKYRDLATRLLEMRDLVATGVDDNQDRLPLRKHATAHGHAVRATYLYAGTADIYTENGDATLLEPLQRVWQDLVARKLYLTGGCGALFDGASPDGSIDQTTITRVHQAFGRSHQLPQSTAHNETCAAIGNVMWNWRMFLITGDARYCDVLEQSLYNSVLTGVSLDGTAFFYTNTLRQLDPMPTELRWPRHRQKTLGCFCCPPNVVRTIAQSSAYAYATSDRGIHVVLYGGSTVTANGAKLIQTTGYPWDGRVRITVEQAPSTDFTIALRIPAWGKGSTVRVNKQRSHSPVELGSFHELRRKWSAGDVIELDLPMSTRLIEAHPLVEEARNHVAVMRGPLVYCVEGVDLPTGVRVLDVRLPLEANLVPVRMKELDDVVALEGKGVTINSAAWGDQLYRDVSVTLRKGQEFHLVLIPYFAWDNRERSEMSVWLPLSA